MDLAKGYPRSPSEMLGGMVWLPRLIDKARASLADTLGGYLYNCAMDIRWFQFTGLAPEQFLEGVRQSRTDEDVLAWVRAQGRPLSAAAIEEFNRMLSGMHPAKEESIKRFEASREKLAPGRSDVTTYFQLLDLEEGRLK